ncbi:hypothetical protein AB0E08_18415 [Streptomyces sp. NPDC048281]|uniref:hypothetical protein n=1 Tax=Streptomyces sp. NPDC048281 TaxID=3154715 RepID=UPI003420FAA3
MSSTIVPVAGVRPCEGVRQARALTEAAADSDSEEQRAWRERRGDFDDVPRLGPVDVLDGCF